MGRGREENGVDHVGVAIVLDARLTPGLTLEEAAQPCMKD